MSVKKIAEKIFESLDALVEDSATSAHKDIIQETMGFLTIDIEWLRDNMSKSNKELFMKIAKYLNDEIVYNDVGV